MILRSPAWKKTSCATQISIGHRCKRGKGTNTPASLPSHVGTPDRGAVEGLGKHLTSLYASSSQNQKQKQLQNRDFLVSVLASAPTKRDSKLYFQTFGPIVARNAAKSKKDLSFPGTTQHGQSPDDAGAIPVGEGICAVDDSPRFTQGPVTESSTSINDRPHIAIAKLWDAESVDDATLGELAKTLAQLRALGLPSVVVVDSALNDPIPNDWLNIVTSQALRLVRALDNFAPVEVVESSMAVDVSLENSTSPLVPSRVFVDLQEPLMRPLREGALVVIPRHAISTDRSEATFVSANDIIGALTRYFSGLQSSDTSPSLLRGNDDTKQQKRIASVHRIIVLDPLGGTPSKHRPNGAHVFLNMEEEFMLAKADIDGISNIPRNIVGNFVGRQAIEMIKQRHRENLDLVKDTLAVLPSTSSAIITTPAEAANLVPVAGSDSADADVFGYVGSVGTRRSKNPLIHNLLTDRPVHSSSLPIRRIKPKARESDTDPPSLSKTTLLKRGMPVTIYPDPRIMPWVPLRPGAPRLRLTDSCIDLPRLVHLIDDSFNRKLDVQHYLDRVNENLAGIIIAGEYEGGAVLTWEHPFGLDEETAYKTSRLVPYLDKFAVLKKSQGAGGVADIVFNAMVRDCFPEGVCWRSRKDNPVNKWYFERSRGTWKLNETNWTMFWTTPWHTVGEKRIWDYENVCRNVVPSWADKKHIVD